MQNVYSHDEIVAFVDSHLKRMGTMAMNDGKITAEVVGWIAQMPPLFQVLTIESRHSIVFADPAVMNRLYSEADQTHTGILGFYSSAVKRYDNIDLNHPVFFHRESRGGAIGAVTARHEKAHDFDLMLGERMTKGKAPARFYSSANRDWEAALERQIGRMCGNTEFADQDPAELLRQDGKQLSNIFAAQNKPDDLYDDYRPLLNHLSLYNTKEKRLSEASAEMGAHYATLYAQTGGDEAAIDLKLSARYPELWAEFRDHVLPQYKAMADEYLAERGQKIARYVERARQIVQIQALGTDEKKMAKMAAVAHAGGHMDQAMDNLEKLARFYSNPIANYAIAIARRDDLFADYEGIAIAAETDEEFGRSTAMYISQKFGVEALSEYYLNVEREIASFEKFIAEYDRVAKALEVKGDAAQYFSHIYPPQNAVEAFKSLHRVGGAKAVDAHIAWIPTTEQIKDFKDAMLALTKLRHGIADDSSGLPHNSAKLRRDIVAALNGIIESGYYRGIVVRTNSLRIETAALQSYFSKVGALANKTSAHTGAKCVKPSGHEILERYEAIRAKSGIDGVDEAAENLCISSSAIKGYVAVRKEYYDWLQSITKYGAAFVPYKRQGNDIALIDRNGSFSEEILSQIAEEVMDFGFHGGAKEMEQRKVTLRQHITDMKRNISGLNVEPLFMGQAPEMQEKISPDTLRRAVIGSLRKFEP